MAAIDSYFHSVLPKRYLKVEGVPEVLEFLSIFLMKGTVDSCMCCVCLLMEMAQQGGWNGAGVAGVQAAVSDFTVLCVHVRLFVFVLFRHQLS